MERRGEKKEKVTESAGVDSCLHRQQKVLMTGTRHDDVRAVGAVTDTVCSMLRQLETSRELRLAQSREWE